MEKSLIEKLRFWLSAEINSRVLSDPPWDSYLKITEQLAREFRTSPLPQKLQEVVKKEAASILLTLMKVRLGKILWELSRGHTPQNVTLEEERLISSLVKIYKIEPYGAKTQDYVVVQFLVPHPAVVTEDFVQIGPFNRGDLAKLPQIDAKELEMRGVVRKFPG